MHSARRREADVASTVGLIGTASADRRDAHIGHFAEPAKID
jgi:hypothetical protein